jgi:hypothetical protein
MNTFYVFSQEKEWKIEAYKCEIMDGQLCFFDRSMRLISAFNSEKWDVCRLFDSVE